MLKTRGARCRRARTGAPAHERGSPDIASAPWRKPRPGDHFVYDKTVDGIVVGGGPIAITAKVAVVKPGEWEVRANEAARGPKRTRAAATFASSSTVDSAGVSRGVVVAALAAE